MLKDDKSAMHTSVRQEMTTHHQPLHMICARAIATTTNLVIKAPFLRVFEAVKRLVDLLELVSIATLVRVVLECRLSMCLLHQFVVDGCALCNVMRCLIYKCAIVLSSHSSDILTQ